MFCTTPGKKSSVYCTLSPDSAKVPAARSATPTDPSRSQLVLWVPMAIGPWMALQPPAWGQDPAPTLGSEQPLSAPTVDANTATEADLDKFTAWFQMSPFMRAWMSANHHAQKDKLMRHDKPLRQLPAH